jgi:hypothetical protein
MRFTFLALKINVQTFSDNQNTIIGEIYQAQATENVFCRTKRPLTNSECYQGVCVGNSCTPGANDMQFYSYSSSVYGYNGAHPAMPPRFMCEEP